MAPTIKVQQLILPNVVDDVNFIRVPKMDRCQTCHLAVDKKGSEKFPQPFTTHPRPDVYLGGSSSHPIDRVGCTVCHEGMGQSVSFRDAAHTPSDEKQKTRWAHQYGWKEPDEWDYPMLPSKMYGFLRAPMAIRPWLNVRMPTFGLDDPNLNGVIRYFGALSNAEGPFRMHEIVRTASEQAAGKQLFELLKCQQCHVLGAIPKDQPTANLAPDLRMAAQRLQPDWILQWLKKPSDILPGTRMPAFWPDHPASPYPQLDGNADAQIEAIRNHLLTLGKGRRDGSGARVTQ